VVKNVGHTMEVFGSTLCYDQSFSFRVCLMFVFVFLVLVFVFLVLFFVFLVCVLSKRQEMWNSTTIGLYFTYT